jgi:YD repeat-containing protein
VFPCFTAGLILPSINTLNDHGQVQRPVFETENTLAGMAFLMAAGRLKKITSGTLQDLAYTYDAVGNILGITDAKSGETQSYTYDSLDRLTGWNMNGIVKELYGYNASTGNLTTSGGATLTYGEQAMIMP